MDAKRVTVRISGESWQELVELTDEDGITISDRVGALVELWRSNPEVQRLLAPVAKETAAETRRRRYNRSKT